MLTKLPAFLLLALVYSTSAQAVPCTDLKSCAKVAGEVTGKVYVWNSDADPIKFFSSQDLDFNKDNADILFTGLLDQAGFGRLPLGDGKTYRIMRGAMMKELEIPVVDASADHTPTFPKTWDWITMRYKVKSPESANHIEQSYRLHVPREARMQADMNAGLLIVTGTAPMVRQMYETIRAADKPLTDATKAQMKEWDRKEMERLKASACNRKKGD